MSDGPTPEERELTIAFIKMIAGRLKTNPTKSFFVGSSDGVILALARDGSDQGAMLRQFVTDEWHARIDTPKPGAS